MLFAFSLPKQESRIPAASKLLGGEVGVSSFFYRTSTWYRNLLSGGQQILRKRAEAIRKETRNEDQVEIARFSERATRCSELEGNLEQCTSQLLRESTRVAVLTEQNSRIPELQQSLNDVTSNLARAIQEQRELKAQIASLTTSLQAERDHNPEKQALLASEFESLATRILEDKSQRFTAQNKENLDELLGPLASKLQDFQRKVEDVYDKETRDRTALATQIEHLRGLNQQLSQDAHDLSHALRGSGKTQGIWGEGILESVLEMSGLRKGKEYELRETYKREDGSRAQPDVVIRLPEDRHIVVDAKVSLTAYVDYSRSDSDSNRKAALSSHLESVRRHIKELSDKNYHALYDLSSLDFVVMFVPLEPAFTLAISEDVDLCELAWARNVLLVSPTTFLFVVRTIANLWRQEQAAHNVREIAGKGAAFYDKLVGFIADLSGIGNRLRQASESYENAKNKLVQGRDNLIGQAEKLRELGVKPSKSLPASLVQLALTEQQSALPELAAVADEEDFEDGPLFMGNVHPASDEDVPF
jgi:DNA recombination protein RmuC